MERSWKHTTRTQKKIRTNSRGHMCVVHATSQVRVADGHAVASLVLVSCEDVQLKPEGNPAKAHSELESCLQSCPIPTDSLLPAKLTSLEQHPHYGFQSEGRTGQRVLALLESSEKSSTITMPGGYAVETAGVKDVLGDPAATVTLTSFCTMEAVAQFRLDPPRGQGRQTSLVLFALVTGQAGDPNQKEKNTWSTTCGCWTRANKNQRKFFSRTSCNGLSASKGVLPLAKEEYPLTAAHMM